MRKLLSILALLFCSSLVAQTTVTLNGTVYTLKSPPVIYFDGAGGVIDTGIKYNGGNAPKAVSTNPPWVGLTTSVTFLMANYPYTNPDNIDLWQSGNIAAEVAAQCYSDNDSPNCTAALYLVNNIEQFFPYYCNEAQTDCVSNGTTGYSTSYYGVYYVAEWIYAFELMQGQMTTLQKQTFADKMLNDLSAFGGIDGSPSTSCTNPSVTSTGSITVTTSSNTLTASAALFGSGNPIQLGYWISMNTGAGYNLAQITSITSSTVATFSSRQASNWSGYSGTIGYRRNTWVAGDCGALWVVKHEATSPQSLNYVSGAPAYGVSAPSPGGYTQNYASNNTYAFYQGELAVLMATVPYDVNASSRSQYEITTLYNDWYTNEFLATEAGLWTGYHTAGQAYGWDRPPKAALMNVILQNSLTAPPSLGGPWDENQLQDYVTNVFPPCQTADPVWGNTGTSMNRGGFDQQTSADFAPIYFVYRNTNLGGYFNWMMRNRLATCGSVGNTPGTNLSWTSSFFSGGGSGSAWAHWTYAETDPAFPSINISTSGPTAVALNTVSGTPNYPQSVLFSKTGYSSVTDTLTIFFSMGDIYSNADHGIPANGEYYPLDYRIIKGEFLLANDGQLGTTFTNIYDDYASGGGQSNYIELGGTYNGRSDYTNKALMPRVNTDGTNNRYAYAMGDASQSYASAVNATRVWRHLVDFKEGQQYMVVYDDIATSSGEEKQTFLHYANNYGASSDSTKGATTVSTNTITSSFPGTGHSDATQLLTQVLSPNSSAPAYVYTNNSNGTYTGGNGNTFRVSVCAATTGATTTCDTSNTAAEFMVVHEPVAGSANTMPTLTQPSCTATGGNCTAVQIGDTSNPKVAVFARQGATLSAVSFTSTHSGTAQYLVAGMAPATYTVTDGSGTTSCIVAANDNTCYFESTSGAVQVTAGGSGSTPSQLSGAIIAGGTIK